jgi:hypothetical protein
MMFGPLGFPQSGSYFDLKKRVTQRMQSAKVNDEIFKAAANIFEQTLNSENIVLSRSEKNRLLSQILKSVLTDMLTKLDGNQ